MFLCFVIEKPSYRSPYFEKLMSDAAAANRTENFDVAQDSVSAEGKQQETSNASSNALPATDLPDASEYQATLNGAHESTKMANRESQQKSQQIIGISHTINSKILMQLKLDQAASFSLILLYSCIFIYIV